MTMYRIESSWKRRKRQTALLFLYAFLLISAAVVSQNKVQAAEVGITVKEINYHNSTITLQVNEPDTEVYVSDSLKQNWEALQGKIDSNRILVMDISWVSVSKNQIVTLKGNNSGQITTVVLPKQATNFKASFNVLKSMVSFSNAGNRTIEWRKKDSSVWHTVNQDTISAELSYFFTHGATVVFRLAPVNGTSNIDVGMRASKEVTVTIPKKTAAPNAKINGSRFAISVNKGTVYRTVYNDGTISDWIIKSSTSDLSLFDVAPQAMYRKDGSQEEVTLQFRRNATGSSQVSNIATVMIPIQEGPPVEEEYGIVLSYTSSSTLSLQVKTASDTMPFEYTIVKENDNLDYKTANWISISSGSPISITKTTAPSKSHIYLRKKSIEASEGAEYKMASMEIDVTGSKGVTYPEPPKADSLTKLITVAGVCSLDNTAGNLAFTLYSPTETKVFAIDLYDIYGNKKGTVVSKSSVSLNTKSTDAADKYLITTKIISTEPINSITNEILYAKITMDNGDVITSTSTTGVHMYLYPYTRVASSKDPDHSSDFRRIYSSIEKEDASTFRFQLNFGTETVIDPSEIDRYTQEKTAINSIVFSGYTLVKNRDYTVEYDYVTGEFGKKTATAIVTVNVGEFEDNVAAKKLDQKVPLIIKLNNNEVLDRNIYITLVSTATIKDIPIAWSITEGSLKETQTKKVTDGDGKTTTISEEVITYTIQLTLFDSSYSVGISDVTWGDTSIMGSATVSAGNATIYLSNAKINRLTTASSDTKSLVITLSNGFVIRSGIKLTIIKAS